MCTEAANPHIELEDHALITSQGQFACCWKKKKKNPLFSFSGSSTGHGDAPAAESHPFEVETLWGID